MHLRWSYPVCGRYSTAALTAACAWFIRNANRFSIRAVWLELGTSSRLRSKWLTSTPAAAPGWSPALLASMLSSSVSSNALCSQITQILSLSHSLSLIWQHRNILNYNYYIPLLTIDRSIKIKILESTGYSALPSPPRLMRRTHTRRDAERHNTFTR